MYWCYRYFLLASSIFGDALIRAVFSTVRKTTFWPIFTVFFKFVRSLAAYRFVVTQTNKHILKYEHSYFSVCMCSRVPHFDRVKRDVPGQRVPFCFPLNVRKIELESTFAHTLYLEHAGKRDFGASEKTSRDIQKKKGKNGLSIHEN